MSVTVLAAHVADYSLQIAGMAILLACSAFFSGSETAFFQLSRKTVRQFSHSALAIERLVARILRDPNRFLTALLFGNMMVNVLFFAGSSILLLKISQRHGSAAGTATGIACFVLLVLFGEMLPKSLAYTNTRRFCLWASPACYIILKVLEPILKMLDWFVVQPTLHLLVRWRKTTAISMKQLKMLLETSRRQGLISNDENQLLAEILKFSFLKVRHVMLPRVEMAACPVNWPASSAKREMIQRRINKIPVYTSGIDHIIGIVHLRDIFLNPDRSLASMARIVHFIPEQKTVESLLGFFKQMCTEHAVVVDEYGGVAGFVELEDVMEQLLGPIEETPDQNPVEAIGPMRYRLLANLSIHEWADAFGIDLAEGRLTTIGGFATALLGKIPKPGDEIRFKNMKFTVETVKNNRIRTIILSLESILNTEQRTKT